MKEVSDLEQKLLHNDFKIKAFIEREKIEMPDVLRRDGERARPIIPQKISKRVAQHPIEESKIPSPDLNFDESKYTCLIANDDPMQLSIL